MYSIDKMFFLFECADAYLKIILINYNSPENIGFTF